MKKKYGTLTCTQENQNKNHKKKVKLIFDRQLTHANLPLASNSLDLFLNMIIKFIIGNEIM